MLEFCPYGEHTGVSYQRHSQILSIFWTNIMNMTSTQGLYSRYLYSVRIREISVRYLWGSVRIFKTIFVLSVRIRENYLIIFNICTLSVRIRENGSDCNMPPSVPPYRFSMRLNNPAEMLTKVSHQNCDHHHHGFSRKVFSDFSWRRDFGTLDFVLCSGRVTCGENKLRCRAYHLILS